MRNATKKPRFRQQRFCMSILKEVHGRAYHVSKHILRLRFGQAHLKSVRGMESQFEASVLSQHQKRFRTLIHIQKREISPLAQDQDENSAPVLFSQQRVELLRRNSRIMKVNTAWWNAASTKSTDCWRPGTLKRSRPATRMFPVLPPMKQDGKSRALQWRSNP